MDLGRASTENANGITEPMSHTRRYRRIGGLVSSRSSPVNSARPETRSIPVLIYKLLPFLSISAVIFVSMDFLIRIFRGFFNRKRERRKIVSFNLFNVVCNDILFCILRLFPSDILFSYKLTLYHHFKNKSALMKLW